jgi:hypothetical protein
MIVDEEIAFLIERHIETKLVLDTICSNLEYYNSILLKGSLKFGYRRINTSTTYLGLAALYGNWEVVEGLLRSGVSADGMDIYSYIASLRNMNNYVNVENEKWKQSGSFWAFDSVNKIEPKYWNTMTEVLDPEDRIILLLPWSTPVILALLSENAKCLSLLLEHGAACNLKHHHYAKALSLCENEQMLEELKEHPKANMKDSAANVLITFNEPLARVLYQAGKKPEQTIMDDIKRRANGTYFCFGDTLYEISASPTLWDKYYEKRYDSCLRFYDYILKPKKEDLESECFDRLDF